MAVPSMASPLRTRRCTRHDTREAAGRCSACNGFFCRECISDHEGQLLCAACLGRTRQTSNTAAQSRWTKPMLHACGSLAGFFVAWLCFYLLGSLLARVPSEVHEGTVWKADAEGADGGHE